MNGKIVVITGASAGVGRAAARAFAQAGAAWVVLLARDAERLQDSCAEIERCGARALSIALDVADAAAVEAAAERVERELGPIDVWVNNAMATIFAPIQDISPEEFARVTQVCYLGTVHGTMSALKRMRARNAGVIVQVGSALAYRAIPLQSAYCGAKHAVRGFTDSIRCELIHDNSAVRITMVQLPGVNTPQFDWCRTSRTQHPQPVGSVFQPEVAARAIVFAATHDRREVQVGMPAVMTILGSKLAPGLLDRMLARRAYEQQFTAEAIAQDRPDNLFQPVPGDFAAHGSFEERAKESSPQLWTSMHRDVLVPALAVAGVTALALLMRQPRPARRLVRSR
jgi:NAD(P)-dependent dehydrogenase (short-subunit alcohol dehydrogenase family)